MRALPGLSIARDQLDRRRLLNRANHRAAHAPADATDNDSECHLVLQQTEISTIACLSFFTLPSAIGVIGKRNSPLHLPISASAVLTGIGLVSMNRLRISGISLN